MNDGDQKSTTGGRRWLPTGVRCGQLAVLSALAMVAVWTGRASSQVTCGEVLPAPLIPFCPGTPARAGEMNHNLRTIAGWIEAKVGPVSSGDVTMAGDVTITGTVTVPNGAFTGAELRDGTVTTADVQDGSLTVADLNPGVVGTGLQTSGSTIQIDPSWLRDQIRTYVRTECSVQIGWRDSCNAPCGLGPARLSPPVRPDGTCMDTDGRADTWCAGTYSAFNADGDMNGDDDMYVTIVCN